jgi:hypothetical protein
MPASLFTGSSGFGVGNIRVDPQRPSDLYVGGYGSIWKSVDYGKTWNELDSMPNPPYLALGHVLAVAGTTPATLWIWVVDSASSKVKGGRMPGNRFASMVLPDPGGPIIRTLWDPAAATEARTSLFTKCHWHKSIRGWRTESRTVLWWNQSCTQAFTFF